jgi:DNA polymerase-3 subunit alpha
MGKKKPKEMAKQSKIFIQGAINNGIDKEVAEYIFNLMEKFAGYGFNKSHSAAYALITYQTAWLKAHFTAAFMAAVLSSDMSNTDKVVLFIHECKDLGLTLLAPDINRSFYKFSVTDTNEILYGLGAIKGVGEAAITSIVDARSKGTFCDLFDFCSRIDLRKVTRRVLEALINAGALDGLGEHRAAIMDNLEFAIHAAEQMHKNLANGQVDLFGSTIVATDLKIEKQVESILPWPEHVRLSKEKAVLGLYLTGHPITAHEEELHKIGIYRIVDLKTKTNKQCKVAGFIVSIRTRPTKRGDRMAFITIDDRTGQQELIVFSDLLQKNRDLLKQDNFIIVDGLITDDTYTDGIRVNVKEITTLDKLRANLAKGIEIVIHNENGLTENFVASLYKTLQKHPHGTCPVIVNYNVENVEAKLRLGRDWLFNPTDELLRDLKQLDENIAAEITYVD